MAGGDRALKVLKTHCLSARHRRVTHACPVCLQHWKLSLFWASCRPAGGPQQSCTLLCRSERTFTLVEQSPAAGRGFTLSSLSTQAKMKSLFVWLLKKERALTCWSLPLVSHREDFEVFVELCLFICALLIELLCELRMHKM